jgi:hypothetical protein
MILTSDIQKCAMFIAYKASDGSYVHMGTAFLVTLPFPEINGSFSYVVTARHVIAKIYQQVVDKVFISANTYEGFNWIETNIDKWIPHPDYRVDVSVIALSFAASVYDIRSLSPTMAVNDEIISKQKIGPGDEIFLTGLFESHIGKHKNLPIVRTGNIALMPEELVEVTIDKKTQQMEAYLIEARSIGGLSGSPVFVYRAYHPGSEKAFYWLGLMHGHWNVKSNEKQESEEISQDAAYIPPHERINMGIAIVVPATKVLEAMNQPYFADARERVIAHYKQFGNLDILRDS